MPHTQSRRTAVASVVLTGLALSMLASCASEAPSPPSGVAVATQQIHIVQPRSVPVPEVPPEVPVPEVPVPEVPPEPIIDDDVLATLQMLEDAGLRAYDTPFAGLTVIEQRDDALVVHYTTGTAQSAAILAAITSVAQSAPVRVVAQETEVNPGKGNELAVRLAERDSTVAEANGIPDAEAVEFDQLSGKITVFVNDEAFTEPRTMLIEGTSVTVISNGTTFVLGTGSDDEP